MIYFEHMVYLANVFGQRIQQVRGEMRLLFDF